MPGRPLRGEKCRPAAEVLYLSGTARSGFYAGFPTDFGIPAGLRHENRSYRTTVRYSGSLSSAVGCAV